MHENNLVSTFCIIDDFCATFEVEWRKSLIESSHNQKLKNPTRKPKLALSEIMTIVIAFHMSGFRTFKHYYLRLVSRYWSKYFPNLVSYPRFVALMKRALLPLFCFLQTILDACTGISFVDSTVLNVCHPKRISSHRTFKDHAARGKVSTGWFFGFKLHIIINHTGGIISFALTAGNISDINGLKSLTKKCFGYLFGDKGYLSKKVFNELYAKGIKLITKIRKNMKNQLLPLLEKLLLKKRGLVESVNNQLKNTCQIEHHRHRSRNNFGINLLAGLAAYQLMEKKPSIQLSQKEEKMLLTL